MVEFTIKKIRSGGLITNYFCTSSCKHCLYKCSPHWEKRYIDPDIAEKICDVLQNTLKKGQYDVRNYKTLAELLSRDLKSVNQDLHLNVWSIRPDSYDQNTEKIDPITRQLHIIRKNASVSFNFNKVEILEGNIGYLELTKFKTIPDPRLEREGSGPGRRFDPGRLESLAGNRRRARPGLAPANAHLTPPVRRAGSAIADRVRPSFLLTPASAPPRIARADVRSLPITRRPSGTVQE